VSHWFELIHLSPQNKPFKTLSIGTTKTCPIACRAQTSSLLILDEAVEGLDDENVACGTAYYPLITRNKI
jgi:ABC-type molybdenum transport system ATPase subunit/photorepair protein PhrA